jgi:hypothetical protein
MRICTVLLLAGCVTPRASEDPSDWYDPGSPLDVQEPMDFTDQNYGFTGPTPIADLPLPEPFQTWFDAADAPGDDACADWVVDPGGDLPEEIEGIATILPRFYFKTNGCQPADNPNAKSSEKYYGSFFVQDSSGGMFVLGDTKVAHFDAGDRVKLKVRAMRENFGQYMIAVSDLDSVEYGPEPIYYQPRQAALGASDIGLVVRAEGVVDGTASTFGEVYFDSDAGVKFKMSLDSELTKRGVAYKAGTRIQVTGPVLYSFNEYEIVVMRAGQVTVLE